jgi:hypothetical protein
MKSAQSDNISTSHSLNIIKQNTSVIIIITFKFSLLSGLNFDCILVFGPFSPIFRVQLFKKYLKVFWEDYDWPCLASIKIALNFGQKIVDTVDAAYCSHFEPDQSNHINRMITVIDNLILLNNLLYLNRTKNADCIKQLIALTSDNIKRAVLMFRKLYNHTHHALYLTKCLWNWIEANCDVKSFIKIWMKKLSHFSKDFFLQLWEFILSRFEEFIFVLFYSHFIIEKILILSF